MKAAEKKPTESVVKKNHLEVLLEEVEVKRIDLENSLSIKVHSFCFQMSEKDFAVAYLKEPEFMAQRVAMDMSMRGSVMDAAEFILDNCIIKEHSDSRIFNEDAEKNNPKLRMGAIMRSKDLVSYYADVAKKK